MKRLLLALWLVFSITTAGFASPYNLPTLGSPTALSPAQQKKLGRDFMRAVRQEVPLIHDPVINDYINSIGYQLASHSSAPTEQFHFFVVNSDTINAFSGPDGYIGIDSALILSTQN